jgi:hypothetical protein
VGVKGLEAKTNGLAVNRQSQSNSDFDFLQNIDWRERIGRTKNIRTFVSFAYIIDRQAFVYVYTIHIHIHIVTFCSCMTIRRNLGSTIQFIDTLYTLHGTTINYSAIADFHNLLFTVIPTTVLSLHLSHPNNGFITVSL